MQFLITRCKGSKVGIFRISPFSITFSEIACPNKAEFCVEPPWIGGTKVCSRHLGHMSKMARSHDQDGHHAHIW